MTKRENESYKRKIDTIADGLMIDAYRASLDEVERIHRDLLVALRDKIDAWFAEHPNSGDGGGNSHPKK